MCGAQPQAKWYFFIHLLPTTIAEQHNHPSPPSSHDVDLHLTLNIILSVQNSTECWRQFNPSHDIIRVRLPDSFQSNFLSRSVHNPDIHWRHGKSSFPSSVPCLNTYSGLTRLGMQLPKNKFIWSINSLMLILWYCYRYQLDHYSSK
jgi:hypothetical protein